MTEDEIKKWLGFTGDNWNRNIRPEIIEGMKDVPMPHGITYEDQLPAFQAFLRCSGPSDSSIFVSPIADHKHVSLLCRLKRDTTHRPCSGTCDGGGTGRICGQPCECPCHE